MEISVPVQLQAMQLDYARQALAEAQSAPMPAIPDPGQVAPPPVPDVIVELSVAAQQLLA